MAGIHIARPHGGHPRTRPDRVRADKARHAVECGINRLKRTGPSRPGTTSSPSATKPPSTSLRSTNGSLITLKQALAVWPGYEVCLPLPDTLA
jgi:hypothetical protein